MITCIAQLYAMVAIGMEWGTTVGSTFLNLQTQAAHYLYLKHYGRGVTPSNDSQENLVLVKLVIKVVLLSKLAKIFVSPSRFIRFDLVKIVIFIKL